MGRLAAEAGQSGGFVLGMVFALLAFRTSRCRQFDDQVVIELNRQAIEELGGSVKELVIVPGASHLFEEPGALEQLAQLAGEWFRQYLSAPASAHEGDSS